MAACRPNRGWSYALREAISDSRHLMPSAIVAIPVSNEEQRIASCLQAFAEQVDLARGSFGILLLLNNCLDRTRPIAEAAALASPWPIRLIECNSPAASAGWARRLAMEAAASWLKEGAHQTSVLLTTDADSRVGTDWVARNLAAIANGADAVAGRIALDAEEAALLPPRLHTRGRREAEYENLLTEICARLDPDPGNPWPCHWSKSGATIAVTLAAYRTVGGVPDMPSGEDRAFVDAIAANDFIVRHDPDIVVVTSARLHGRATGGVADTMRLRCEIPESLCDDRLEPLRRVVMRSRLLRRLRRLHDDGKLAETRAWAPRLQIANAVARQIAAYESFGHVYAAIERASPHLDYRPLRPCDLELHIRYARWFVRFLRAVGTRQTAPHWPTAPKAMPVSGTGGPALRPAG